MFRRYISFQKKSSHHVSFTVCFNKGEVEKEKRRKINRERVSQARSQDR